MRNILLATALFSLIFTVGCASTAVQSAARQQAPTYYGRPYDQLSPQEKMRLENHLARHDNAAWHTGAHVASGVGRLLQGVGVLIFSVR